MKQTMSILTVTGSDSTGGSGVQADTRVIAELGGQAYSAITCVTMQNTLGIQEFYDLPAAVVEAQIEAVVNDVEPGVVKIGLLRSVEMVAMVARLLRRYKPRYVVYDPTVRSARGDVLMSADVIRAVADELLPLCTYVVERGEPMAHGSGNRFASAVCVFLSQGQTLDAAVLHAREYLLQRQSQIVDQQNNRAAELYQMFIERVERFFRLYNDVAFYADELNVSRRYLAQVTRRVASKSPKAIIEDRLLGEVEREMSLTAKPLRQIAAELGFSSAAHLTRFFKQHKGTSPSKYRKTK